LRFALGVTDPGDLIALSPSVRPSELGQGRAQVFCSGKARGFDFPVPKQLPNLGENKVDPVRAEEWSIGLPAEVPGSADLIALIDEPTMHSIKELRLGDLAGGSVLVVGSSHSGKSWFTSRVGEIAADLMVLDCPSLEELESAFQEHGQVICSVASSFIMPMALVRRFEHVIYLRQNNLDQHLACMLPRTQWNEKLPAGRGWYREKVIQLVMPTQIQATHTRASVPQQLAG
jgi:hypothetical protein